MSERKDMGYCPICKQLKETHLHTREEINLLKDYLIEHFGEKLDVLVQNWNDIQTAWNCVLELPTDELLKVWEVFMEFLNDFENQVKTVRNSISERKNRDYAT